MEEHRSHLHRHLASKGCRKLGPGPAACPAAWWERPSFLLPLGLPPKIGRVRLHCSLNEALTHLKTCALFLLVLIYLNTLSKRNSVLSSQRSHSPKNSLVVFMVPGNPHLKRDTARPGRYCQVEQRDGPVQSARDVFIRTTHSDVLRCCLTVVLLPPLPQLAWLPILHLTSHHPVHGCHPTLLLYPLLSPQLFSLLGTSPDPVCSEGQYRSFNKPTRPSIHPHPRARPRRHLPGRHRGARTPAQTFLWMWEILGEEQG